MTKKIKLNISGKLSLLLIVVGVVISLILGFFYYRASAQEIEKSLGIRLKHIAKTAALLVPFQDHEAIHNDYLSQSETIYESPHFKRVREILKKVKNSNELSSDIYTIITPDWAPGRMVYIAMSNERPYTGNSSPLSSVVKKALLSKKATYSKLYTDEEGHWISGVAPILDDQGRIFAFIEIDYHADQEVAESKEKAILLIVELIAGAILLLLIIGTYLGRISSKPILMLSDMASEISKGNLNIKNDIQRNDEIGILATTFNGLALDLKKKNNEIQNYVENLESMVKERTKNLEDQKKFSESIVDSMQDMLFVLDSNGKIVLTNKITQKKLEMNSQELQEINIRDLIESEEVERIKKFNFEEESYFETNLKRDTNSEIPVLLTRSKIRTEINPENDPVIYTAKDLTAKKKTEAQIEEQRAVMAQSSRLAALGEMASGIAHEINNPVTIMEGQIRRLTDYMDDQEITYDEKITLIDKIKKNLERVVKIVSGLRKISRKSDKDQLLPMNLKDVVSEVIDLCGEKYAKSSIDIQVAQISGTEEVMGREAEIIQVLLNLIGNAHDAIIDKDERKWIQIKEEIKESDVQIRVIDCGEGIEQVHLEKIFQPFFTTKDIGKGTGIGLSISKKIMEEHNGDLFYDHDSDHTCFVLSFPKVA